MECSLWRLLISSRSISKHGYHRNLVGIIYGMFSMKIAHFVQMGWQTWPPHAFLVSDWLIFKKSSPLKLLSHMNWNLVGSIYMYGRFCIKFPQSRMKGEWHRLRVYFSSTINKLFWLPNDHLYGLLKGQRFCINSSKFDVFPFWTDCTESF